MRSPYKTITMCTMVGCQKSQSRSRRHGHPCTALCRRFLQ